MLAERSLDSGMYSRPTPIDIQAGGGQGGQVVGTSRSRVGHCRGCKGTFRPGQALGLRGGEVAAPTLAAVC